MSTVIKTKLHVLFVLLSFFAISHCSAMQKGLTKKQRLALATSLLALSAAGEIDQVPLATQTEPIGKTVLPQPKHSAPPQRWKAPRPQHRKNVKPIHQPKRR